MTTRLLRRSDRVAWLAFMHDIEGSFRPYKMPAAEFGNIVDAVDELHIATFTEEGRIACYGMIRGMDHESGVPMIGVATAKPYRHRGLAAAMMERLQSLAKDEGFAAVGLHVDDDNEDAKRLYTRLGYKQEGDKWLLRL